MDEARSKTDDSLLVGYSLDEVAAKQIRVSHCLTQSEYDSLLISYTTRLIQNNHSQASPDPWGFAAMDDEADRKNTRPPCRGYL